MNFQTDSNGFEWEASSAVPSAAWQAILSSAFPVYLPRQLVHLIHDSGAVTGCTLCSDRETFQIAFLASQNPKPTVLIITNTLTWVALVTGTDKGRLVSDQV